VLVDVVFTDRSGIKLRPAVVLSTFDYHQMGPDVVIAPITSNLNTAAAGFEAARPRLPSRSEEGAHDGKRGPGANCRSGAVSR
jgi:mRNA-degrading endonuclease toxin of MazEF toxin-antitoxin module